MGDRPKPTPVSSPAVERYLAGIAPADPDVHPRSQPLQPTKPAWQRPPGFRYWQRVLKRKNLDLHRGATLPTKKPLGWRQSRLKKNLERPSIGPGPSRLTKPDQTDRLPVSVTAFTAWLM